MRRDARRILVGIAILFGIDAAGAAALAQAYPVKPVKIVVGFAAGGPTDVIARLLGQDMSATLGQSFLVENKTGANALIATEDVAHAAPDGYTVLFASLSHNVNKLLVANARYDPIKDFAPVGMAAVLPLLVVTRAGAPYNSVHDIIQAAKQAPGDLTYGSAGNGGSAHLAGALLETLAGVKMTHVPFRGNAPALAEVMAGRVTFMFYPMIGIADQVAQKRLKVLAVGTAKRRADFPSVPTMAEAGFPGFEETAPWVGMLAPAGTPAGVVDKLYDAMRASLDKPATRERLKALGADVVESGPAEFKAFLVKDKERWERVIKAAGVKGQ